MYPCANNGQLCLPHVLVVMCVSRSDLMDGLVHFCCHQMWHCRWEQPQAHFSSTQGVWLGSSFFPHLTHVLAKLALASQPPLYQLPSPNAKVSPHNQIPCSLLVSLCLFLHNSIYLGKSTIFSLKTLWWLIPQRENQTLKSQLSPFSSLLKPSVSSSHAGFPGLPTFLFALRKPLPPRC